MREKQTLYGDTTGELIVGPANAQSDRPNGPQKYNVHLKLVVGTKVVQGWFDADQLLEVVKTLRDKEAQRMGDKP